MGDTGSARISPGSSGLSGALADFGFRLYHQIPREGNAFFSPLSVGAALAALVPGARSDTLAELQGVLGLHHGRDDVAVGLPGLLEALEPRTRTESVWNEANGEIRTAETETYRLTLATALFVEEAYPLHTAYCDVLSRAFRAEFFSLVFADAEGAARRVNDWVRERTERRIERLISPSDIVAETRLVLANAVYFKARWTDPFPERATQPRPFHLLPETGSTVEVPMMRTTATYRYSHDPGLDLEALRIPYDEAVSMLVLLPAVGRFREAEDAMSTALVDGLRREGAPRLVRVELPRFEMRCELPLKEALASLGLVNAFDPERADFGGITPPPRRLSLSQVVHQAWVEVDERGTEAAAATAVVTAGLAEPVGEPEPVPFVVDRPFLFLIRDERTGAVLFQGRVLDPRSGAP